MRVKAMAWTTDRVRLSNVDLGPFKITVRNDFDVQVHPEGTVTKSRGSGLIHPHVSGYTHGLCLGDGKVMFARAVQRGDIGTAFDVVSGVLATYNGSSAYTRISDFVSRTRIACPQCGNYPRLSLAYQHMHRHVHRQAVCQDCGEHGPPCNRCYSVVKYRDRSMVLCSTCRDNSKLIFAGACISCTRSMYLADNVSKATELPAGLYTVIPADWRHLMSEYWQAEAATHMHAYANQSEQLCPDPVCRHKAYTKFLSLNSSNTAARRLMLPADVPLYWMGELFLGMIKNRLESGSYGIYGKDILCRSFDRPLPDGRGIEPVLIITKKNADSLEITITASALYRLVSRQLRVTAHMVVIKKPDRQRYSINNQSGSLDSHASSLAWRIRDYF